MLKSSRPCPQGRVGYKREESGDASKALVFAKWDFADRVQEVIPVRRSKAYRATEVKQVGLDGLIDGRDGAECHAGLDVSKDEIMAVLRWSSAEFERPWRAKNPQELGALVALLTGVARRCRLTVALEPTGTYGDPLRQTLADAGLVPHRVSPKAAHDYAEVFDGVPSQHDGKDAAIVAELAAQAKSRPWPYEPPSDSDAELAYWVDWLDAHQREQVMWLGRLEGLLARHWPEATETLPLSSVTLLRTLERYGGPAGLASDAAAADQLARWGGRYLKREKIDELLRGATTSLGVRTGAWDVHRLQSFAREALSSREQVQESKRQLARLSASNPVIQAQSAAVGVATACVLWVHLGDPRHYDCGAAYRKAMGLNLKERSSGRWQGRLMITKRGRSAVRRWLYFAALRRVRDSAIRPWYEAKKRTDEDRAKRALVGVMRKLALALYQVGACGAVFESRLLFPGIAARRREQFEEATA